MTGTSLLVILSSFECCPNLMERLILYVWWNVESSVWLGFQAERSCIELVFSLKLRCNFLVLFTFVCLNRRNSVRYFSCYNEWKILPCHVQQDMAKESLQFNSFTLCQWTVFMLMWWLFKFHSWSWPTLWESGLSPWPCAWIAGEVQPLTPIEPHSLLPAAPGSPCVAGSTSFLPAPRTPLSYTPAHPRPLPPKTGESLITVKVLRYTLCGSCFSHIL